VTYGAELLLLSATNVRMLMAVGAGIYQNGILNEMHVASGFRCVIEKCIQSDRASGDDVMMR
jgi:hypothetical protein